jgi:hypothetical protein
MPGSHGANFPCALRRAADIHGHTRAKGAKRRLRESDPGIHDLVALSAVLRAPGEGLGLIGRVMPPHPNRERECTRQEALLIMRVE